MFKPSDVSSRLSRRYFLGAAAAASLTSPLGAFAATPGEAERWLAFRHIHTGQRIKALYWADGDYIAESLGEIDSFLADFRTGDIHPIDVDRMDVAGSEVGEERIDLAERFGDVVAVGPIERLDPLAGMDMAEGQPALGLAGRGGKGAERARQGRGRGGAEKISAGKAAGDVRGLEHETDYLLELPYGLTVRAIKNR